MPIAERLNLATAKLVTCSPVAAVGQVVSVSGLSIETAGLCSYLSLGDHVTLEARDGRCLAGQIVGFPRGSASIMSDVPPSGVGPGSAARIEPLWNSPSFGSRLAHMAVSDLWLGRVVDARAEPLDGKGPMPRGEEPRAVHALPPAATQRARLGRRIDLGVRVLDLFTPMRHGQRLGLFAGSGVGKSTLMAMLARHTDCDVAVIALVGERGREVREFVEEELGAEGLARSVVVVATSDSSPLLRREAAYTAMTVAEHFRDRGRNVLLLMDSATRFCWALREIALSQGEPPASRGYPPSVFAELPRLLERAGPGPERPNGPSGQITALITVLVDGDDHNEPIADAIRGILDGHIKLDRRIAEAGRYPAVDALGSLSRTASNILTARESAIARRGRAIMALWREMGEMIRLGVYRPGSDPVIEEAIRITPKVEELLNQSKGDRTNSVESFRLLEQMLDQPNAN